jgi:succinate dehydrogenase / fumarate reductase cytochrome b subunit
MSASVSESAALRKTASPGALARIFSSSIGQKAVMAVTGIALSGFVLLHMLGNLAAFQGTNAQGVHALDAYGALLRQVPAALWAMRIGLLVAVLLHIWAYLALTRTSWAARPTGYSKTQYREATYASRTMRWTGPLLAAFIIFHLGDLTTGAFNPAFAEGAVYNNLLASLQRGGVAAFYLIALGALALHLWHGIWSLFQTLGLSQPRHQSLGRRLATLFTLLVVLGFALVPLAVIFGMLRPL